jgi:uncharacterized membrane protein
MSEAEKEREASADPNIELEPTGAGRVHRTPFGRRMRNYFLTGMIVLLPAVISIFVLWRLFTALDQILGRFVEIYLGYKIPGVGLVALVLIIIGIGAIASNIIGKRLIGVVEGIVARIPIMRWIYQTTKQLFSTLLAERSTSFRKVVLIHYPYKGMYSMAFQTSETAGPVENAVGGKRLVTLFLPTTPNPTSGYFLLVPEDEVMPLDISVNEGLRYIISAGALAQGNEEPVPPPGETTGPLDGPGNDEAGE